MSVNMKEKPIKYVLSIGDIIVLAIPDDSPEKVFSVDDEFMRELPMLDTDYNRDIIAEGLNHFLNTYQIKYN